MARRGGGRGDRQAGGRRCAQGSGQDEANDKVGWVALLALVGGLGAEWALGGEWLDEWTRGMGALVDDGWVVHSYHYLVPSNGCMEVPLLGDLSTYLARHWVRAGPDTNRQ